LVNNRWVNNSGWVSNGGWVNNDDIIVYSISWLVNNSGGLSGINSSGGDGWLVINSGDNSWLDNNGDNSWLDNNSGVTNSGSIWYGSYGRNNWDNSWGWPFLHGDWCTDYFSSGGGCTDYFGGCTDYFGGCTDYFDIGIAGRVLLGWWELISIRHNENRQDRWWRPVCFWWCFRGDDNCEFS